MFRPLAYSFSSGLTAPLSVRRVVYFHGFVVLCLFVCCLFGEHASARPRSLQRTSASAPLPHRPARRGRCLRNNNDNNNNIHKNIHNNIHNHNNNNNNNNMNTNTNTNSKNNTHIVVVTIIIVCIIITLTTCLPLTTTPFEAVRSLLSSELFSRRLCIRPRICVIYIYIYIYIYSYI